MMPEMVEKGIASCLMVAMTSFDYGDYFVHLYGVRLSF